MVQGKWFPQIVWVQLTYQFYSAGNKNNEEDSAGGSGEALCWCWNYMATLLDPRYKDGQV